VKSAVVTVVRGREVHLRRQARAMAQMAPGPDAYVVVALDERAPQRPHPYAEIVHLPTLDGRPIPLAAARNAGLAAAAARADLVICLDVDCLPEPGMIAAYTRAAADPGAADRILAGPVGRLGPLEDAVVAPGADDLRRSRDAARRGPRPVPERGAWADEPRIELFWSLSFAVTPAAHARIGGFDEAYEGYGAEDTDYAFRARRAGLGLRWVGGAWAHHQHHPVSTPPVEHLRDIVANATRFHRTWGTWPMEGWLQAFADAGLIAWHPGASAIQPVEGP
jgi:hypothetical protein